MSEASEFFNEGRASLLSGDLRPETAPAENHPRWGASAVLRPSDPQILESLADLVKSVGAAAGDGHWAHRTNSLHFTLRALESYRSSIPAGDARRTAYQEALTAAAENMPFARVELRGVRPHPAGVVAVGHPLDGVLATVQSQFTEELRNRDAAGFETWVRDRWYVSLLHFAGPVANPARVARWCDERRNLRIGVVALNHAEVIRWHFTGDGVQAQSLHKAPLGNGSVLGSRPASRTA